VVVHQKREGDLGDCRGRLVVTFNEVGLAAAVVGFGLVFMTVGAGRKEISEGLLVRADWDIGEVELHPVFRARKVVDLVASSSVMIFPSGSRLRSEFPRDQRAWRLLTCVCCRSE
jgi:hypothetical protein